MAGHELGERESEVARGAGGGSGWLAGWLGVARDGEKESREQRVRREREEMHEMGRSELPCVFWKMVYGKFFRKPFSSFSFAILRSKTNIFSFDFHFTSKQTSANVENVLRKTFSVETNGALVLEVDIQ